MHNGQYYILCIEVYKGCSFNKIYVSLLISIYLNYGECLENYEKNSNSKNTTSL